MKKFKSWFPGLCSFWIMNGTSIIVLLDTATFMNCKEHLPRSCKVFLMVKITEVPTISIVLNGLFNG